MAEAIARHLIDSGELGPFEEKMFAVSAGTSALDGSTVSPEAIHALARLGIGHDGRSKRLTAKMIRGADWVFGMTANHVHQARQLVASEREQVSKIVPLDPDGDVEDPIGLGDAAYDRLARVLMELVPKQLAEMQKL